MHEYFSRREVRSSITAGLLLLCAAVLAAATQPPAARNPASPPAWTDVQQPVKFFNLSTPEFPRLPLTYEAHRYRRGGGRQDILTLGKLGSGEPYFRFALYRVGSEAAPQQSLFAHLDLMATGAGLSIVARSPAPQDVATRFGDFETADLDLADGRAAPARCMGFRKVALEGSFRISGFACGTTEKPLSRVALACLLDRLDLASDGDDRELAGFFAASELWRDPVCAGTGLAPMLLKANWIDQRGAPPLRLLQTQ